MGRGECFAKQDFGKKFLVFFSTQLRFPPPPHSPNTHTQKKIKMVSPVHTFQFFFFKYKLLLLNTIIYIIT